jgi:SpoVK/Ycf46/Vps4 family AAA+-type ATPase
MRVDQAAYRSRIAAVAALGLLAAAALLWAFDRAARVALVEIAAAVIVAAGVYALHRFSPAPRAGGVAPARLRDVALPGTTAGEIATLVDLLRSSRRARALGVELPAGALLVGPPGTGKTLIARAIATETRRSFFACDAASLTSPWAGASTQAVAGVFADARASAPCVLFLDEIDAVAGNRDTIGRYGGAAAADRQQAVDQLLQEIDGVRGASGGVFILAATNHPDALDPALRSRLAYVVHVGLPDAPARVAILRGLWPRRCTASVGDVAQMTDGMSGRELRELVRIAGLLALGERADAVTADHFRRALERIEPAGLEQDAWR